MRDPTGPLDVDSWAFAVKLYTEPGVAESCLRLQAEAGVDVMLLLCIAFACVQRGLRLSAADIEDLDALCRPWREQIVLPLRLLRTALQSGPSPAPSAATEPLRSQIRASELVAERLQNDLLARQLRKHAAAESVLTREDVRVVFDHVVALALWQRGSGLAADLSPVIDTIVAAAMAV